MPTILQSAGRKAHHQQQGKGAMYPAIDPMLTDDEFKDVIDRVVITADLQYLARFSGDF